MREAVWEPFLDFFRKDRALEIAAFLLLYRLADNLAASLVRPFLVEAHFDPFDIGVASAMGLVVTTLGTFVGGFFTTRLGLGRALWLFGLLQALAGAGYALVAAVGVNRPLMYAGMAWESWASGMGLGAFGVLLLRLTQKRFSATQYALFSSVFALGRTIAGPIAGSTVACGAPGLAMLQRFVPLGSRDLPEDSGAGLARAAMAAMTRLGIAARSLAAAAVAASAGLAVSATLGALKQSHEGKGFDLTAALLRDLQPTAVSEGLVVGLGYAAYLAARSQSQPAKGEGT